MGSEMCIRDRFQIAYIVNETGIHNASLAGSADSRNRIANTACPAQIIPSTTPRIESTSRRGERNRSHVRLIAARDWIFDNERVENFVSTYSVRLRYSAKENVFESRVSAFDSKAGL